MGTQANEGIEEMKKTASITITISTNPTFSERYFADFRDTTGGVRRTQLRTWHLDREPLLEAIATLRAQSEKFDVELTVTDTTGEVLTAACDGGQWCRCPKSTPLASGTTSGPAGTPSTG